MLGTPNPFLNGQQGGELVAGCGRIAGSPAQLRDRAQVLSGSRGTRPVPPPPAGRTPRPTTGYNAGRETCPGHAGGPSRAAAGRSGGPATRTAPRACRHRGTASHRPQPVAGRVTGTAHPHGGRSALRTDVPASAPSRSSCTPSFFKYRPPSGHVAADGRPRDSLLFTAPEGGPVTDGHFRNRVWYPAITAAGIRRFPPRIMRHTAASWLVQDGVPLYDVQALLGTKITRPPSGTRTWRPTHTARSWNPGRAVLTHP